MLEKEGHCATSLHDKITYLIIVEIKRLWFDSGWATLKEE
jgi:hypothetical protein